MSLQCIKESLLFLVVKNGLWSLAKELCKTGCVIGHRRDLWCQTLAVDTSEPEVCAIEISMINTIKLVGNYILCLLIDELLLCIFFPARLSL